MSHSDTTADAIKTYNHTQVASGTQIVREPHVVLLDISMPLLIGIDACKQLMKTSPQAKVIFVTMHADADYVAEAFRAGGSGYLLKRSPPRW
jgi:DNA-binding NarL/FixJ family response regulator